MLLYLDLSVGLNLRDGEMTVDDHTIERLLARFQTEKLPEVVRRDIRLGMAPGRADVLIGMRRSGKTYVMFQEMRMLLGKGVPKSRMLYLNLEDDRLGEPDTGLLDRALELFYRADPDARSAGAYLFFDEIHVVPGWERFVRRVLDTEDVRMVLAGSSAKLMSTEVHTSLRGRSLAAEVLPFGLREYVRAQGLEPGESWPPSPRQESRLAAFFDEYLMRGGFPDVIGLNAFDRVQMLQDYVESVTLRDVVERHRVENFTALRHLVRALVAANANGLSVSSLHGVLVNQGVKVGKATLLQYLDHLVDAYLVFLVSVRTRSEKQRIVNPRKVYMVDPGLAFAMQTGGARNMGARLENAVYLELRRRVGCRATDAITYYKTERGREVDFAIDPVMPGEELELCQSCAALSDPETREREVGALVEAMEETGVRSAVIVTIGDRETIEMPEGIIEVLPYWEWALRPFGRPA